MEDNSIKLFESKQIRTAWNEEEEKWYFSVVDVVAALTDSANPTDYLKKMRQRDPELSKGWGQIVTPLPYNTAGGPQKMNFADTESIARNQLCRLIIIPKTRTKKNNFKTQII